jgi:hypothetical protein
MPVKSPPKERPLLEMFLSEYENGAWRNAVPDWVEERMDGAVEVIATRGDGQTVAIEHTIVQPFVGEKSDSNAFMQAFGRIEKNPDLVVAGRCMTVVIPVGAIPKGYKWEEVGADLLAWLIVNHATARMEGDTNFIVPVGSSSKAGPLQLPIVLQSMQIVGYAGSTVIARGSAPKTLPEIVEEALSRKLPKLVKTLADRRIFLIEREQIGLGDLQVIREIERLAPQFPDLKEVHEIWIVETSIQASEGWVYFRRFDGRGLVETMDFELGSLKRRRNDDGSLGPPQRIGMAVV